MTREEIIKERSRGSILTELRLGIHLLTNLNQILHNDKIKEALQLLIEEAVINRAWRSKDADSSNPLT